MTADQLFQFCNTLALPGWILLIVGYYKSEAWKWAKGVVVMLLCCVYAYLLVTHFKPADASSFGSLEGVTELFRKNDPYLMVMGWVHYLAFDLMAGYYVISRGKQAGIALGWLLGCLFFTFMTGPVGLLLFFIIRAIQNRVWMTS